MSVVVDVQVEVAVSAEISPQIEAAVLATLTHQQRDESATVNVLLTDDATVQRLNADYRGYDKTTDVLSFSDGEPAFPNGPIHWGDIVISVPQAARQAEAGGHDVSAEILLLTVHGTLHLLGHDHAIHSEKAAMWAAQAAILIQLNAPITAPAVE